MPLPLPIIVSDEKKELIEIFKPYLLSESYGYSISSRISNELIKNIIIHKSFGATFTFEIRGEKMKYNDILLAINNLANAIETYLKNKPFHKKEDYDIWHKKIGEQFILDCEKYKKFKFGKAQKIINVTMKHLFCYNISEEYFQFCHIALDSMTYTGRPSNSLDGGFYKFEVCPNANTKSFSNLTYDEYKSVQDEMRNYLDGNHDYKDTKTGKNLTPFKCEFYIWPRYKK